VVLVQFCCAYRVDGLPAVVVAFECVDSSESVELVEGDARAPVLCFFAFTGVHVPVAEYSVIQFEVAAVKLHQLSEVKAFYSGQVVHLIPKKERTAPRCMCM
jgi:hypothetical protein